MYDGAGNRLQQVGYASAQPITTTYTNDNLGLSQVLVANDGATITHNLFGLDLVQQDNGTTTRTLLADGLGSVRTEMVDGAVETVTTYEPYGNLLAQTGTSGTVYGFTGEQHDSATGLLYLQARYYNPYLNQFQSRDPFAGNAKLPQSQNGYSYANNNPINFTDPSGNISESEKFYIRTLYNWYIKDTTTRLNITSLTNLSNNAFAAMIAAKILFEDATIYADQQPEGLGRELVTLPISFLRDKPRDWIEDALFGGEISWGPANIPLPLAIQNLEWWERNHECLGLNFNDVHTYYYDAQDRNWFERWLLGSEQSQIALELQTGEGAVQAVALAILQSASRARQHWSTIGEPSHELSAYTIALGVNAYSASNSTLYTISGWTSKGSHWVWVEAIDDAADVLDIGPLVVPTDYIPYTEEEKQKLDTLP